MLWRVTHSAISLSLGYEAYVCQGILGIPPGSHVDMNLAGRTDTVALVAVDHRTHSSHFPCRFKSSSLQLNAVNQ